MKKSIYTKFSTAQLELRDYLALERTILSNERTLLSYAQNGLAFAVTGVTAYFALNTTEFKIVGATLVLVGIAVISTGIIRFRKVKSRLDEASPAESADIAAKVLSEANHEKADK